MSLIYKEINKQGDADQQESSARQRQDEAQVGFSFLCRSRAFIKLQQIYIFCWREIAAVCQSAGYQQMTLGRQYRAEVGYSL